MDRDSAQGAPSIDCLHILGQSRSIRASMCISNLARSRPRCASLSSLDHGLQTRSITASECISNHARLPPRSTSRRSLNHGLQTRSITASKFGRSWPPKCISNLAQSRSPSASLCSLDRNLQAHLYLLSSTACSQSRYTVCRWVAILIHRYIDT